MKPNEVAHLSRQELEIVIEVLEQANNLRDSLTKTGLRDEQFFPSWSRALEICKVAGGQV